MERRFLSQRIVTMVFVKAEERTTIRQKDWIIPYRHPPNVSRYGPRKNATPVRSFAACILPVMIQSWIQLSSVGGGLEGREKKKCKEHSSFHYEGSKPGMLFSWETIMKTFFDHTFNFLRNLNVLLITDRIEKMWIWKGMRLILSKRLCLVTFL